MNTLKKWYSFSENAVYNGDEPFFFNIENKPWKKIIEDNYLIILAEFQQIINDNNRNIIPYFNQTLATTPTAWTIFPLLRWGKKYKENCQTCPQTVKIIENIEGLTSSTFSILKPDTKIKPHFGDSNVMYRCHLTLKCNGTLPDIGMRVGDTKISWQTGKVFAFCDAYNHEVWNNTGEERWILIFDILREEFSSVEKQICAEVNATLWWQLKFQKFYFIKHLPKWSRRWLMQITALFM
jgi:aspartyl/asparaginyl beta-hydroxylase (cupin superfamily)